MADLGQIVTDSEAASIPSWPQGVGSSWPLLNQIILKMVEAEILGKANMVVGETAYTREEYTIETPVRRDNVVTHAKDLIMIQHAPIKTWTKLEVVQQRDSSTGLPTVVSEIPRQAYNVAMDSGIVRLLYSVPLDPSIWPYPMSLDPNNLWPFAGSFPPGVAGLLATYSGGVSSVPYDLKGLALMVMARTWKKFQNSDWELASISMQGASTAYLDVAFTKRELSILNRYQRGVFPSFH